MCTKFLVRRRYKAVDGEFGGKIRFSQASPGGNGGQYLQLGSCLEAVVEVVFLLLLSKIMGGDGGGTTLGGSLADERRMLKEDPHNFKGWAVTASSGVFMCVFTMMTYFVPSVTLGAVHENLHLSVAVAALPLNAHKIALLSFLPFTAFFIRLMTVRGLIISAALLSAVAALLMPFAQNIWHLVIIDIIFGISTATCGVPSLFHVVISWFPGRAGFPCASVIVGWSMSGVLAPKILATLVEMYGWRTAASCGAMVYCSVAIPLAVFAIRPRPEEECDGDALLNEKAPQSSLRELMSKETFWFLGGVFFSGALVIGTNMDHLMVFLTLERHLTLSNAAVCMSVLNAGALVTKVCAGYISDQTGHTKVLLVGGIILLLSVLSLFRESTSMQFYTVSAMLFGIGYACSFCSMNTSIPILFGRNAAVLVQGLMLSVFHLGSALGSTFAGIVVSATSSYTMSFVVSVFAMLVFIACSLGCMRAEFSKLGQDPSEVFPLLRMKKSLSQAYIGKGFPKESSAFMKRSISQAYLGQNTKEGLYV